MNTDSMILWTRVDGAKSKREATLIGRSISRDWLTGSVSLARVRFVSEMKTAFGDLIDAAKASKINLPIVSLRTAMLCQLDNVITLDRHLGLRPDRTGTLPPAIELYAPLEYALPGVRETLARVVKRWLIDDVETWAERHGLGHLAERLRESVLPGAFDLTPVQTTYINDNGQPNFALIAREIGERLVGESLFDGLGACELVASPDYTSNSVELMTRPKRGDGRYREDTYSMVARLTVASVPYSGDIYLSVSAMKRVWAKKVPAVQFRSSSMVSAYVMAVGRPVSRVNVIKTQDGWAFGDEYATLQRESGNNLPKDLAEAIGRREFDEHNGWWVGLPELPALFRSVSPRTVFEGDEVSLLQTVSTLLDPLLSNRPIPIREVKLPRFQAKPRQEMLKLTDFGTAGGVFAQAVEGDEDEEDGIEEDSVLRKANLDLYREQNTTALRQVHDGKMPVIWLLSDYQTEKGLVKKTVGVLFGDAVTVYDEPLPEGTHGLRANLDLPAGKARQRFDARVKQWQPSAERIRELSGDRHIVVLICVSDRVSTKPEDAVNYYAGIHALSAIGANVHHVLPIESPDDPKSQQNFLHRVQSALLDVMLAHSGAVFGVKAFVERLPIPADRLPKAIYGVQAVRSRAQTRSGQTGVNFVLFTRVVVESGNTEVRIGYRDGSTQMTDWMPLAKGLSWMGSQRHLQEGDDDWLKGAFEELTRRALVDIHAEDPNAVVMTQWDSVRSLWRGISDADLAAGNPPKLGNLSLSRFEGMTFIRLRRSIDTLSLRTLVKAVFRGWCNGEPTGELQQDMYATTDMRLVEIVNEALPETRRFGHYIASMGYTKTVQVKRGFSCYRNMPRMAQIGKGTREYELKILDVASLDASLPAPMDMTVMSSPSGMPPSVYAILAMGLRLGYAHHNDWTKLPMPMFFRAKIEDYIIRYPDDDDVGLVLTGDTQEPTASTGSVLSEKVIQAVEGEVDAAPTLDESTPDPLGSPRQENDTDLLSRVRHTPMPFIHEHQDFHGRQLYHRMFNGDARVRVELPYWVKTAGIFNLTGEVTKRRLRRSWDWLRDFGYVKQHGVEMPSADHYLDWLADKLRIPQTCSTIVNATRGIGQITYAEMAELIERDYNSAHPDEPVNPYNIEGGAFERMVRWSCEQGHDVLLGWLVFMAAQLPNLEWTDAITEHLSAMPGPRTQHALEYYLATAAAIQTVLEHKGKTGNLVVLRDLPKIEIPVPADSPSVIPLPQTDPAAISEPHLELHITEKQEGNLTMITKQTLVELIEAIEPGSEQFDSLLSSIQAQIKVLEGIHADQISLHAASQALASKMRQFEERQQAMAAQINAMRDDLGILGVEPCSIDASILERAQAELADIEEAVGNLEALLKVLNDLESAPKPSNLQERKKRSDIALQVTDNAFIRSGEVRHLLESCTCYTLTQPGEPDVPPDEMPPSPDTPVDEPPVPPETPALATEFSLAMAEPPPVTLSLFPEAPVEPVAPPIIEAVEIVEAPVPPPAPVTVKAVAAPTPIPVRVEPKPMSLPMDEEEADTPCMTGEIALVSQMEVLRRLVNSRLYGLADVHVAAIGKMIEGEDNPELQVHHTILHALVQALDAMDCQFLFDTKLDPRLSEVLSADRLPSGRVADPAFMALGILAAGLGNMLFDEIEVQWRIGNAVSSRLSSHLALLGLVEHLDVIRVRGLALTRDLFVRSRIGDKNAIEHELARFHKRAATWKDAPEIHSNFHNYSFKNAHAEMFNPNTPIGKCLTLIARGDTTRLPAAYEEAKPKFKRPNQAIDDAFKRIKDRTKPEGTYRLMMFENIEATEKFVVSYLDLVNRRDTQNAELTRDMQAFLDALNAKLSESISEAGALQPASEIERLYRDAAIKAFQCVIQLFDAGEPAACIPDNKQRLLLQVSLGKDLMPALNQSDDLTPPLCTPEHVFTQLQQLADEPITMGEPGSEDDIDKALADAYQGHIAAKRFLPAFLIAPLLPVHKVPKGVTLEQQYHIERDALVALLQDARQKVAHAMTLNALPSEEAMRMQWLIEELHTLCHRNGRSVGRAEVESAVYPDFPQARASLRCNVQQPLETRLKESRAKLETDLATIEATGLVQASDILRIRDMLESSNAATLLTAQDALNMLQQSGKLPARLAASAHNLADEYDDFIDQLRKSTGRNKHLLDDLKIRLSAPPDPEHDPEWLSRLDEEQRNDAVAFIDAWIAFFNARNPNKVEFTERLFQSMGMANLPTYMPENGRPNRARFILDVNTFRYFTTAPEDPLFIPPVLGSSSTHSMCVAIFGNPQESDIRQTLTEIGNVPSLVMARTQFNMQKRAKVAFPHPTLYIDDDLIAYAALHTGESLPALIKVGMLTFTTNPYDDYTTKPVPSEMFFGRQSELTSLRAVKGLAVLYGGRRLGKSSLLSQIELELRNVPGQAAVYISMDTVTTAGDYVSSAWEFIYRALLSRRLIAPIAGPVPTHWKPIQQHIEKQLVESGILKSLYLLIDEADNLMGCELRRTPDEESFVRTLTQLADDLNHACHIRMVIAGLHNMTRMANDANSVFGKADPIPLKPFTGVDDVQRGIRLITKPLAAMGFLFRPGDEDLAMRIMAVCNNYPAFIQLYCKRLVEHLQNNRQDKKPPYFITADMLNVVEKDNNLLSELREKFALNLKLDKRYKAIALILADVYYTEVENGQYTGLSTADLREHCEAYCPRHFENSSIGVYEALLDEMCKLNVIERSGIHYLLRNPNIAMMLGDKNRVITLLTGLADEPPETSRNQGERRICMTLHNSGSMSFPMPMSWIRNHMDTSDGQLLILTGNALSGLMDLTRVGREEWKLQEGMFSSAPVTQPNQLLQLIDRQRRTTHDGREPKILAVREAAWRVDQVGDYAAVAQKASKHGIRIMLLATPARALELTRALENNSLKPSTDSQRSWRVVPIPPWSDDAIHYHVQENVKVADRPDALAAIRTATCGFGKAVLDLCTPSLTLEEALASPATNRSLLAPSLEAFYQHIGLPPTLGADRRKDIEEFLGMINSMDRSHYADREETMAIYRITESMWAFLYWMGLIQEGPAHTWLVPKLYIDLLTS